MLLTVRHASAHGTESVFVHPPTVDDGGIMHYVFQVVRLAGRPLSPFCSTRYLFTYAMEFSKTRHKYLTRE